MAPRIEKTIVAAVMAQVGRKGGLARAKSLTKAERIAIARKGGKAGGKGWPKGKKRGPSPLKGRKVAR